MTYYNMPLIVVYDLDGVVKLIHPRRVPTGPEQEQLLDEINRILLFNEPNIAVCELAAIRAQDNKPIKWQALRPYALNQASDVALRGWYKKVEIRPALEKTVSTDRTIEAVLAVA